VSAWSRDMRAKSTAGLRGLGAADRRRAADGVADCSAAVKPLTPVANATPTARPDAKVRIDIESRSYGREGDCEATGRDYAGALVLLLIATRECARVSHCRRLPAASSGVTP